MKKAHSLLLSLILIVIAFISLTACSSKKDQVAFCNLMPGPEAEKILGEYQTTEITGLSNGAFGCKYISNANNSKTFNVIGHVAPDKSGILQEFDYAINKWKTGKFENRTFKDITDVADGGFWAYNDKTPQFIAYKNNKLVLVTLGSLGTSEEEQLKTAESIATTFLSQVWT